jgi:mannose-1-phosphate guanylyltransferase / phosphomannomutase
MQVVILAGGQGTRMGELTRSVPKPMVPLAGRPILEHQVALARRYGFTDLVFLTGHLGEVIERHFGDGADWGVSVRYYREQTPLGTAGALKAVEDWLQGPLLVFYGDTVLDVDLQCLADFHLQRRPLATLVVHPNSHPYDSDLVALDAQQRIVGFHAKPHAPDRCYPNCANAALYAMSPELLEFVPRGRFADLGREVFPMLVEQGRTLLGYRTPEYIKDVGTVPRLRQVEQDVLSGKVARLNRRHPRRAIFLDRDGVLNPDCEPAVTAETLRLLPGVAQAVRRINESEFLAVVVTNQPAVAKGWLSVADLEAVHAKLETLLGAEHAYLDRIYYCPHHPDKGFAGEVPEYKIGCTCRKPDPGMLLAAAADLHIDLAGSWMIGDRTVDLEAGRRAGCRTALVRTGLGGSDGRFDCRPDAVFADLDEATRHVLQLQPSGVAPPAAPPPRD